MIQQMAAGAHGKDDSPSGEVRSLLCVERFDGILTTVQPWMCAGGGRQIGGDIGDQHAAADGDHHARPVLRRHTGNTAKAP